MGTDDVDARRSALSGGERFIIYVGAGVEGSIGMCNILARHTLPAA